MSSKKTKTYKKHKASGKIYDPESMLVIKSQDEKIVVGRIEDDQFVTLDETCLELCEKYGFKYDESLVEEEEEEQQEDEKEEEIPSKKEEVEEPKSQSVKEENKIVETTTNIHTSSDTFEKMVSDLLSSYNSLKLRHSKELEEMKSKHSETVEELAKVKGELDKTKIKLKNVLVAMQENL